MEYVLFCMVYELSVSRNVKEIEEMDRIILIIKRFKRQEENDLYSFFVLGYQYNCFVINVFLDNLPSTSL